jgi:hypothetical protein
MPRKAGKKELRRIFNDPAVREEIVSRTVQRVDVSENPASPECNQGEGTMSYIYDWMGFNRETGLIELLATVHMFKRLDGSVGASGQPDPVVVVVARKHGRGSGPQCKRC